MEKDLSIQKCIECGELTGNINRDEEFWLCYSCGITNNNKAWVTFK